MKMEPKFNYQNLITKEQNLPYEITIQQLYTPMYDSHIAYNGLHAA